jgi:hypothetical protein
MGLPLDTIFVAYMLLIARESLAAVLQTTPPRHAHFSVWGDASAAVCALHLWLRCRCHRILPGKPFLPGHCIWRFHADDGSALFPVVWDDAEEAAPSDALTLAPIAVVGAGVASSHQSRWSRIPHPRGAKHERMRCCRGVRAGWTRLRRGRWFCLADSTVLPWRCSEERLWSIAEPPPRAPICLSTAWFDGQPWRVMAWPADTPAHAPWASSDLPRAKGTQHRTPRAPRCGVHATPPTSDTSLAYSCRSADHPSTAGSGLPSALPTAAPDEAVVADGAAEEPPAPKPSDALWPGSWIWSITAPLADRYVHAIPHRLRIRPPPPPAHAGRLVAAAPSAAAAAAAAAECSCSLCRCRGSCSGALAGEVGEGRCECDSGYSGPNCSDSRLVVAHARLQLSASCPNGCSAHGVCRNLRCACTQGWTGGDCSIECAGGADNPCSGRGECLFNGTCACHADYGGKDCSKRLVQARKEARSLLGLNGAACACARRGGVVCRSTSRSSGRRSCWRSSRRTSSSRSVTIASPSTL